MPSYIVEVLAENDVEIVQGSDTDVIEVIQGGPQGIPGKANVRHFSDIIQPPKYAPVTPEQVQVNFLGQVPPSWWATNTAIRWDSADSVWLWSQVPEPYGYWVDGVGQPTLGCSFPGNNGSDKPFDGEVIITGKKFALRFLCYSTTGDVQIWIDGQPITAGGVDLVDSTGTGAWNWITFEFDTVESHHFRVAGGPVFFGVDYDPTFPVYMHQPKRPPTMLVASDSYWEENVSGGMLSFTNSFAVHFRTLTGVRVINNAQGGTGFINKGGGADGSGDPLPGVRPIPGSPFISSEYGSAANLAFIASQEFDFGLAWGSGNDGLPFDPVHMITAAEQFFADVAVSHPRAAWIWVGIEPVSWFRAPSNADRENAMIAAAADIPTVTGFISAYNEQWLTGTGHFGATVGDGNQDLLIDSIGVHPNTPGAQWFMRLLVAALQTIPIELGA